MNVKINENAMQLFPENERERKLVIELHESLHGAFMLQRSNIMEMAFTYYGNGVIESLLVKNRPVGIKLPKVKPSKIFK